MKQLGFFFAPPTVKKGAAVRSHNEWFMTTVRNRCDCGLTRAQRVSKGLDPQGYIWGEYHNAKWRCIRYCCQGCIDSVFRQLKAHTDPCGCTINFCARSGHSIAEWITAGEATCNVKAA